MVRISFILLLSVFICQLAQRRTFARPRAAFECTTRQEAEDLAIVEAKEYRFHQAMVRLGICALQQDQVEKANEKMFERQTKGKENLSGQNKFQEGVSWLEKAAALGDPEAKNNLAILHSKGIVEQIQGELRPDHKKALSLFLEAASDGCADAQFNLAVMHDTGRGGVVIADPTAAAHWFQQVCIQSRIQRRSTFICSHGLMASVSCPLFEN